MVRDSVALHRGSDAKFIRHYEGTTEELIAPLAGSACLEPTSGDTRRGLNNVAYGLIMQELGRAIPACGFASVQSGLVMPHLRLGDEDKSVAARWRGNHQRSLLSGLQTTAACSPRASTAVRDQRFQAWITSRVSGSPSCENWTK
jgi:hypothetical protein